MIPESNLNIKRFNEHDLVVAINEVRENLLKHRSKLFVIDQKIEDVIWPLVKYKRVRLSDFEKPSMCLLADDEELTIYLSRTIVKEFATKIPSPYGFMAIIWFWCHQLVHITQGLSYQTFRELNGSGSREHMTRMDCWSDFISLKAFAWLQVLHTSSDEYNHQTAQVSLYYREKLFELACKVSPLMLGISPNLFFPTKREIELQRIIGLFIIRFYIEESYKNNSLNIIDGCIFPQWLEKQDKLYIWLNHDRLLGRSPIDVDPNLLNSILDNIQAGLHDDAYRNVKKLALPQL
jgi:hypothetical protein